MKHVGMKELHRPRDLPENEVFAVHDEIEQKSMFVLTPSGKPVHVFAFGIKIKDQVYTSNWVGENQPKDVAREAMKQILFIKKAGWYATDEQKYDELGLHKENVFRCAYCELETIEPRSPCICRQVASKMQKV